MRQLLLLERSSRDIVDRSKLCLYQKCYLPLRNHSSSNATATKILPPSQRRPVSKYQRETLRLARKTRAMELVQSSTSNASSSGAGAGAATNTIRSTKNTKWFWYLGFGVPTGLVIWGVLDDNSPLSKLASLLGVKSYFDEFADFYAKPCRDQLLPDWSQMPNVPQDIPVPHTLVLDLENTLVSSTWDRKYGWRHAKRPGVDKFLTTMAQYYEIVLYTPSNEGLADPVVTNLDKHACIMHRLYQSETYYKNGVHLKDLSKLNRNLNKIIMLDDNPDEIHNTPHNVIKVKPYNDPMDQDDKTLENLIPFLVEIAREGYDDIPELLSQFDGMDADQIADEHKRRIHDLKLNRMNRQQQGFTKFFNMDASASRPAPELDPSFIDLDSIDAPIDGQQKSLTSKDLVGAAPPTDGIDDGSTGGMMNWLKKRQKDQQEQQMLKMEKWNEVMIRKQEEKKQKEQGL